MVTQARLSIPFLIFAAFCCAASASDRPREIVIVAGEFEYSSMETLRQLSDQLQEVPGLKVTFLRRHGGEDMPGLEALRNADLMIGFIRRMTPPPADLALYRGYLDSGRPLIGIRTMCHAFQNWPTFDRDVLGGNYHDHYTGEHIATARVVPSELGNPLVAGVPAEFPYASSLYKLSPLVPGTTLLINASLDKDPAVVEPVAWTHRYHGGRIFFTSLGDPGDFAREPFLRLLANAIAWTLQDPALASEVRLRPIDRLPVHRVAADEFSQYLSFSSYILVDARPADAFAAKHARRSVSLDPDAADFGQRVAGLDRAHNYIVAGSSGDEAKRVADALNAAGCAHVNFLDSAYTPVTRAPKAKRTTATP